jgi:hypothetical protein
VNPVWVIVRREPNIDPCDAADDRRVDLQARKHVSGDPKPRKNRGRSGFEGVLGRAS